MAKLFRLLFRGITLFPIAVLGCRSKTPDLTVKDINTDSSSTLKPYCGAEVYSNRKFTYGRIEAKMKPSIVSGLVSSAFTFGELDHWTEIDIEFLGKYSNMFQTSIISGDKGTKKQFGSKLVNTHDLNGPDHIYTIEWTPKFVRWLVDGFEVDRRSEGDPQVKFIQGSSQSIHLNFWPSRSAGWAGPIDKVSLPAEVGYDWIKFYSYHENSKESGEFKLEWQDDFNFFDSSNWNKADWTFEGNEAQFSAKNVKIKDGRLVLIVSNAVKNTLNKTDPCF